MDTSRIAYLDMMKGIGIFFSSFGSCVKYWNSLSLDLFFSYASIFPFIWICLSPFK